MIEMSSSFSGNDDYIENVFMKDLLHRNVPCYVELLKHHRPEPLKKIGHWLNLVDNSKDCDHVTCHVIDDCEDTDNNNNDIC